MAETIVDIDSIIKEVRGVWETDLYMPKVTVFLKQKLGIKIKEPEEKIIVFGMEQWGIGEYVIGTLKAIAPGIVIFNPSTKTPRDYLKTFAGFLVRSKYPYHLFSLKPFFMRSLWSSATLHISSASNTQEVPSHLRNCPVFVRWEVLNGGYGHLGIDPDRWRFMEEWLNRWLPK